MVQVPMRPVPITQSDDTTAGGGGADVFVPGTTVSEPGIVLIPSTAVFISQIVASGMRLLISPVAVKFPLTKTYPVFVSA